MAERQAARILGAEHAILETLFPRHVIEHLAAMKAQHMPALSRDENGSMSEPACSVGVPPHDGSFRGYKSSSSFESRSDAAKNAGILATSHAQVGIS